MTYVKLEDAVRIVRAATMTTGNMSGPVVAPSAVDVLVERLRALAPVVEPPAHSPTMAQLVTDYERAHAAPVVEVPGALDAKLDLHSGGCAKYQDRPCNCLSAAARLELAALREKAELRRMRDVGADRLADEVAALVRRHIIDSRSPAGDALLDYREPPCSERSDRLADLEDTCAALREKAAREAAMQSAVNWILNDAQWKAPEQVGYVAQRWLDRLEEFRALSAPTEPRS